jgi:spore coat polysaccharide biosynthesis protein SpsF
MLNTLGVIDVERDAFGGPAQAGRKVGGKSVVEWVVRRATDCQRLDGVVVALPDTSEGRSWGKAAPPETPVHYSSKTDALARSLDVARRYSARAIVRISAHSFFVDPVLVDRLVNTARTRVGCDYIGYAGHDGRPAAATAKGLFAEWVRVEALERAEREAHALADREQVSRYIYFRPEEFGVLLLPTDVNTADVGRKLDRVDHWELAETIYDALGPEEWDWHRVVSLVA